MISISAKVQKKTATKMLKITLEVKPTIKAEYSPGIVDCKPLQKPMSSLRRNRSKHSLWDFWGLYSPFGSWLTLSDDD